MPAARVAGRAALLLAAIGVATAPTPVLAAPGDTATDAGLAAAEVIRPLTAEAIADLSFGALVVGATAGGEVTVAPGGGLASYSGSVRASCGGDSACAPHPALFQVSGEAGRAYAIELPASVQALGSRTGRALDVTALVTSSATRPALGHGAGLLGADGTDSFTVGGTLQVPAGTAPDLFRADLPVIVHYS